MASKHQEAKLGHFGRGEGPRGEARAEVDVCSREGRRRWRGGACKNKMARRRAKDGVGRAAAAAPAIHGSNVCVCARCSEEGRRERSGRSSRRRQLGRHHLKA